MRQVALALLSILGPVSVAAGGTIDGKIEGWPVQQFDPSRPAVVWLEGTTSFTPTAARPVMAQRSGQFVPPFLVVIAGQTVEMPNQDEVAHNVYSNSAAKSFNLGYYAKGEHKSVTFDRPGMADTLCVLHRSMRARILVVPNRYYAMVAPDGSFRIRNVPAGKFAVTWWSEGLTSFRLQVTVPAGSSPLVVRIPSPQAASAK
jgi:plastocyanin